MPTTSPDAPFIVSSTLTFSNAMGSMVDYIFSGTLERFPKLTLVQQGQVGWMPYVMERRQAWEERSANSFGTVAGATVELRQADLRLHLRRRDRPRESHVIGMDQTAETDYLARRLHASHSKATAEKICSEAGLNEEEVYKFIRGNAIRARPRTLRHHEAQRVRPFCGAASPARRTAAGRSCGRARLSASAPASDMSSPRR